MIPFWVALSVFLLLQLFLYLSRKPGKFGKIGKKIRNSDYWAWRDAIEERQESLKKYKLLQLGYRDVNVRTYYQNLINDLNGELDQLNKMNYKLEE